MQVTKSVYDKLLTLPAAPPEMGGIIGGSGGVVSELFLDRGAARYDRAIYTPDTKRLNEQIRRWGRAGIAFMGVFHTHPAWEDELSQADEDYIRRIMSAMPDRVERLHFPLVLPGKAINWYSGQKIGTTLNIQLERVQIQK